VDAYCEALRCVASADTNSVCTVMYTGSQYCGTACFCTVPQRATTFQSQAGLVVELTCTVATLPIEA